MTLLDPGGFRPTTFTFAEESTQGEIPTDPAYETIADTLISVEYEGVGAEQVERPAIGESVADLRAGVTEPSVSVSYELSRWIYDSGGNPDDLSGYAINRVAGRPYSSLMARHEITLGDNAAGVYIQPEATLEAIEGSASSPTAKESRRIAVIKGIEVEEATLTGDPTEAVWTVESSLAAEDVRLYQFDQPTSSQTVEVASTDAADTDLHVTIEDDAGSTETLQLDGTDATTAVTGTTSFDSIANVAVFADDSGSPGDRSRNHAGNITVTGSTSTELYAVMHGVDSYETSDAASGTPLTGAGSTTSAPTDPLQPHRMTVERPTGTALIPEGDVANIEISLGVDMTRTPTSGTSQRVYPGMVSPEFSVTYDGETAAMQLTQEQRNSTATDTVVDFNGDGTYTVTFPDAKVMEATESQSAGETQAENEATFRAQSLPTPASVDKS